MRQRRTHIMKLLSATLTCILMSGTANSADFYNPYAALLPCFASLRNSSQSYSPEALKTVVKKCGNKNAAYAAAIAAVLIPLIARKRHAVRSREINNNLKIAPQEQVYTENSVQTKNTEVAVTRSQLPQRAAQAQKRVNNLLYSAYVFAVACGLYALVYALLGKQV